MEKKLKFKLPSIVTYTSDAHIIGILGAREETKSWIMCNFIQLYINKDPYKWQWGDYYFQSSYEQRAFETCRWFTVQKMTEQFVHEHWDSMVKFVRELIIDDYYVDIMLNYRYISRGYHNEQDTDFVHDSLIYGFNDERKVFYCADFPMSESRKYTLYECSYEDFEKAAGKSVLELDSYMKHMIHALQLKDECGYEYDIENIISLLEGYLNQSVPEYWTSFNHANKKNLVFGTAYYKVMADFLKTGPEEIRHEMVYLLKSHANIMIDRIDFLKESFKNPDSYIAEYQRLIDRISLAVILVVKYMISRRKETAIRAASILYECMEAECDVLKKIIAELKEKK